MHNENTNLNDKLPFLISHIDSDFKYQYVNKAYSDWFNQTKSEIIGKSVREIIGAEAFKQVEADLKRALKGEIVEYETKMKYENKESTFVKLRLLPDLNSQGEVDGIIATVEDLSDLEMKYQKLNNLDKAKSEFLKIISHELNTPLNGILGFSNLLKENLQNPGDKEILDFVLGSAERLLSLSKTAMLITQLSGNLYKIQAQPQDLSPLIKQCVINKKSQTDKGFSINLNVPDKNLSACYDTELIRQVFEHLIDNSRKHAGDEVVLDISVEENGSFLDIHFRDNGIGFSDTYLAYLYDFFASFDSSRVADKRYGLGLAFTNLVMEAHDGKISIENMKEGGAQVKLQFLKHQCPMEAQDQ